MPTVGTERSVTTAVSFLAAPVPQDGLTASSALLALVGVGIVVAALVLFLRRKR